MIYADYNGSAPLLPVVKEYLEQRLKSDLFANPNAIHSMGQKLNAGIEKCRSIIASVLHCYPDQIIFNSGSSEGVSQILFSVLEYAPKDKKIIITSPIEHAVIPSALNFYQDRRGFIIKHVEVDESGVVNLKSLENLLNTYKNQVALVTIMAANNETGVIQPFEEIAKLSHESGVEYFADTTQIIGKAAFDFEKSGMDYAVCAGHKVGALTGTGFIIAKDSTKLHPYIFGSHQEKGLRGGTQNYLGIETLAVAFNDFAGSHIQLENLKRSRVNFEKDLKKEFPELVILGSNATRLPGTTMVSYPGIHSQAVQIELESHDIFVTTSAACSDNQPETSAVLKAMKIHDDIGRGVIRLSLSYHQGEHEYSTILAALKTSYNKLRKIHSY